MYCNDNIDDYYNKYHRVTFFMSVKNKQIHQNLFMLPSVVCIVTYYGKIKKFMRYKFM